LLPRKATADVLVAIEVAAEVVVDDASAAVTGVEVVEAGAGG
jgi:hypothetical protein